MKSYKDLEIYKKSYELAMKLHKSTMKLPKHELYEEGTQIRRASKSISVNIVEGFGRRKYKNEFIKFLIYALSSCDEIIVHLNFIHDSGYILKKEFDEYSKEYYYLGRMINNFIKSVERNHKL